PLFPYTTLFRSCPTSGPSTPEPTRTFSPNSAHPAERPRSAKPVGMLVPPPTCRTKHHDKPTPNACADRRVTRCSRQVSRDESVCAGGPVGSVTSTACRQRQLRQGPQGRARVRTRPVFEALIGERAPHTTIR